MCGDVWRCMKIHGVVISTNLYTFPLIFNHLHTSLHILTPLQHPHIHFYISTHRHPTVHVLPYIYASLPISTPSHHLRTSHTTLLTSTQSQTSPLHNSPLNSTHLHSFQTSHTSPTHILHIPTPLAHISTQFITTSSHPISHGHSWPYISHIPHTSYLHPTVPISHHLAISSYISTNLYPSPSISTHLLKCGDLR